MDGKKARSKDRAFFMPRPLHLLPRFRGADAPDVNRYTRTPSPRFCGEVTNPLL